MSMTARVDTPSVSKVRGRAGIAGIPSLRRLMPWMLVVLLPLVAAFATLQLTGIAMERNYRAVLDTEAARRGLEITAATTNSNVMGSVAALGLINQAAKGVAQGVTPRDHPAILETLKTIGQSYDASGVFLTGKDGIIQSSWDKDGKSSTGLDVRFRPYFQVAMQGRQNVYGAVSVSQGRKAIYVSAPLYDEASLSSQVIGVVSARLESSRIDATMKAWTSGPALLVSPQGVTFAGNDAALVDHLTATKTPEELESIRQSKQSGIRFDGGIPKVLPFDFRNDTVMFRNGRYAVSRFPVQWNDPNGEWTLVLLGELDALMSGPLRATIGGASGGVVLVFSLLFLAWRNRMNRADSERRRADEDLKANALRLAADSETKSFLADVSSDLQKANSLEEFAAKFLSLVAPRLGAGFGAFYVFDDKARQLTPVGWYGASTGNSEAIAFGQGLVGQCAMDAKPIVLSEPAQTDMRITWGGGTLAPKEIVVAPVVQAGRVLGVLVLAALNPFDADRRALLDALLPPMAMTLEILERNLATRRQAQALAESEAFTRALMDSSPAGLFLATIEGKARFASARWNEMHGYTKEDLVDFRTSDLYVDPEDRKPFIAGLQATGRVQNYEIRIRRKDGGEIWSLLNASLVKVGEEQLVATWVNDVTAQHEAVERVREMAKELEAIFEAATAGIAFVKDRVIVRGNGRLNELFGFTAEEQVGKSTRIWYPDDESYVAGGGEVYEALKRGETHQREQRLRRKDGSLFWCRLSGRAVDPADPSRGSVWMLEETNRR